MKSIVIAPHPDDEVLGVGGTLLRRKLEGGEIAWVVVTGISIDEGWSLKKVQERAKEIEKIAFFFQFDKVFELNFPSTKLDQIPMASLIKKLSDIFDEFMPEEVFIPHSSDVHTDHKIVFQAVASCVKWFRHPSVKRVLAYETLSETDFGLNEAKNFRPNFYINIESQIDEKIKAMQIYSSELAPHPFPRSCEAINALATLRGAAAGFRKAEAFQLLKEVV
jgi:LmbE family N-acetylglucosaminyl deacetylase